MSQPNRAQWAILWTAALVVILVWPPDSGRSLALLATRWLADPSGVLPSMPEPLPMALDDDGDAVAAHDAQEIAYYHALSRSAATRWRMRLKEARVPWDVSTLRQLLVGVAVLSALASWRLNTSGWRQER
jgi:hypothetical protein